MSERPFDGLRKMAGVTIRVSREMALDYGLVEPTETERQEREAATERYREQKARRDAARIALRDRLASAVDSEVSDGVAAQVMALHRMAGDDRWPTCDHCYDGGDMGDHQDWPCATALAVAAGLGIAYQEDM